MKNILVLDDDPVIREIFKVELSKFKKYNIFLATNGVEGLEILESNDIDVLITDLLMPEFDGIQMVSYMKENHINIPVIVITGVTDKDVLNEIKKLGIADIILKPIDFSKLEKKIGKKLKNPSSFENKIDLLSLCKLFINEKRSQALWITAGKSKGKLYIKTGRIVYAEFNEQIGKKAIELLFSLSDTKVELMGSIGKYKSNLSEADWETVYEKFFSFNKNEKSDLDLKKIKDAIEKLREDLGEDLISTEIWNSKSLEVVDGYNTDSKNRSKFHRIASLMNNSLKESSLPILNDYYLIDLKQNMFILVLQFENYQWGILVDKSNGVTGYILSILIKKLKKIFRSAEL